jgi:hypothetical protein
MTVALRDMAILHEAQVERKPLNAKAANSSPILILAHNPQDLVDFESEGCWKFEPNAEESGSTTRRRKHCGDRKTVCDDNPQSTCDLVRPALVLVM